MTSYRSLASDVVSSVSISQCVRIVYINIHIIDFRRI